MNLQETSDARTLPVRPEPALPPGPSGLAAVSHYLTMRRNRLSFFTNLANDYGDVAHFRVGPVLEAQGRRGRPELRSTSAILVRHPDGIKHVLQDNARNYSKNTRGFDRLRSVLGDGLLTSEGASWLKRRRIAQPAFHHQRVASLVPPVCRAAQEMLDRWEPWAAEGRAFDVGREMMRATLRVVGETMLGTDVEGEADAVREALASAIRYSNRTAFGVLSLPEWVPTRQHQKLRDAKATLDRIVLACIERRRALEERPHDLLTLLMEARDADTGETMTDAQLRDEVMTIFVSGHETTANALTWALSLLAQNPGAQDRLRAEVLSTLGGRAPTFQDMALLPYARMVMQEAMRLYPPVWIIGRQATADDQIGGFRIPAGCTVFVSPYVTHRAPGLWEDPERFDPDRFSPAREKQVPRFAYFPFGGGPRQCIGNTFALLEAQVVLAMVAQRYRLKLEDGQTVLPESRVVLKPREAVRMKAA